MVSHDTTGDFHVFQFAVDGVLTGPFYVLKSHQDQFPTDRAWMDYLCRQADSMLDLYGDVRSQRPPEAQHAEA
jgi:hypothetical protein